jgi:hypothetical protein
MREQQLGLEPRGRSRGAEQYDRGGERVPQGHERSRDDGRL